MYRMDNTCTIYIYMCNFLAFVMLTFRRIVAAQCTRKQFITSLTQCKIVTIPHNECNSVICMDLFYMFTEIATVKQKSALN